MFIAGVEALEDTFAIALAQHFDTEVNLISQKNISFSVIVSVFLYVTKKETNKLLWMSMQIVSAK